MKPIIGITCSVQKVDYYEGKEECWVLPDSYIDAIRESGGYPIMIPFCSDPDMVYAIDGLVISGGGDISPTYYGASFHPKAYGEEPNRDQFEISLIKLSLKKRIPILAICRGIQILNVALGGSLIQHIPDQVPNSNCHWQHIEGHLPIHSVEIFPGKLAQAMDINKSVRVIKVNSFHHQSISVLPNDLNISARSEDGVIEGVELKGENWVVGVQWHPELMVKSQPQQQQLFKTFVNETLKKKLNVI